MQRITALLFLSLLFPALAAPQAPPAHLANTRDGGASEVLQSIYIPALLNAPFTAIVHTEWQRPIAGGGSITLVNQRRVARDAQGRIYQERWLLVPRGAEARSRNNLIQIADPNAHTLYNCYLLREPHRCVLETFAQPAVNSFKPPTSATGPLPNNAGFSSHEDLGLGSIESIDTHGVRDTITYNEGTMGNDRPFSVTREFWNAPSLGINLISELDDPRIGKQSFTITDVRLGEPDPALFELPDGYTVDDSRKALPPVE